MRIKTLLAVSAISAAVPVPALADRMSYAFVQLNGIFDAQADVFTDLAPSVDRDSDGTGLGFEAGWIYGPYAFSDVRFDDYNIDDIEAQEGSARLGVRGKFPLRDPMRLDGYGAISLEAVRAEVDTPAGSAIDIIDDEGFGVHAGLRFAPVKYVEFMGEVMLSDVGDFDGRFVTAGVQWNISDYFALNLRYRTGDYDGTAVIAGVDQGVTVDIDSFRLGVRLQWGGG